MQTLVIGCETYYKKTFSEEIQDKMIFHDHIGFNPKIWENKANQSSAV